MSEQQKLFDLLRAGVTPFMCVDECERRLTEADFEKINYGEAWSLVPGGKYVMNHHGTALFAFNSKGAFSSVAWLYMGSEQKNNVILIIRVKILFTV